MAKYSTLLSFLTDRGKYGLLMLKPPCELGLWGSGVSGDDLEGMKGEMMQKGEE